MLEVKEQLILNKPKKAGRLLKRIDKEIVQDINLSLFNFLKYTTFKLLKDEENAAIWKKDVSAIDLKRAELILNN